MSDDLLEDIRTKVHVGVKAPSHVQGYESVKSFVGKDNALSLKQFKEDLQIQIISKTRDHIIFDLIGVDAAFANALRRILIAEVPTMAISKVKLFQNTSIIQDEVLCHRLGLLPIKADPRLFQDVKDTPNELNTLVFTLDVTCTRKKEDEANLSLDETFENHTIYAKSMEWIPQGKQAQRFAADKPQMVHDDIIIAKMRPGQVIEMECHVTKGIGSMHAKWSPVCTASYRLLPEITLMQPFVKEEAEALVKLCPMDVFDIEDLGLLGARATVARPRNCSMCRECIRKPEWNDKIRLRRVRNHFIFSIESTGVYSPGDLFKESLKVLMGKCDTVLGEL